MADKPDKQPIIKKIKKSAEHGHHGGSWKIAYADFVTAMMAFFLLMWLLNATSEEQKRGIANYFDPVSVGTSGGGNWGVMGGMSISDKDGSASSSTSQIVLKQTPPREKGFGGQSGGKGKEESNDPALEKKVDKYDQPGPVNRESEEIAKTSLNNQETLPVPAQAVSKEQEKKAFQEIKETIQKNIEEHPELKELVKNLLIDETEEGLRIQILDREKKSMFPNGSSRMYKPMQDLLEQVSKAIQNVPNHISISGHTDSTPYSDNRIFGNWELSTERANASRRVLRNAGIDDTRFESVVGRADKDLFNKADPKSEENRRISIVLLHQT